MGIPLTELVHYLDEYLRIDDVPDDPDAMNGLQVEGPTEVRRVAVAVDACLATIAGAALWGTDLLIVHHGLFFGPKVPITGAFHRRISALVRHRMGVYACHAPLDVHSEVGNNAVLARGIGMEIEGTFGDYHGGPAGVYGSLAMERDDLIQKLEELLGATPRLLPHGLWQTNRVGICTGGAGSLVAAAGAAGIDTFITGEAPHYAALVAEEVGMNLILGGHYATETVGVGALSEHLTEQFDLETQFIDHPTGL